MSSIHSISLAELAVFRQAYADQKVVASPAEKKVIDLVEAAFRDKHTLVLTDEKAWGVFRSLEIKLLGRSWSQSSFEEKIGISSRTTGPEITEIQYELNAFSTLIAPWDWEGLGIGREPIEDFKMLRKDEQKLLLKALTHFSFSKLPLILTRKEGIVLFAMARRVQEISGKERAPLFIEESQKFSLDLFKTFYPVYKKATLSSEDVEAGKEVERLTNNLIEGLPEIESDKERKALIILENHGSGSTFPGIEKLSFAKGLELRERGEKRIFGEIREDYKHLVAGWKDIKIRMAEGDTNASIDLITLFDKCQVVEAKAFVLKNLYHPHVRDPEFSYLYGKALYVFADILHLESEMREAMDGRGLVSALERESENPVTLDLKDEKLYPEAKFFLERAHLLGHPKAGIYYAAVLRAEKEMDEKKCAQACAFLAPAIDAKDETALLELGLLGSAAWQAGVINSENAAIKTLEKLGQKGGDALYAHFLNGSEKAGDKLLELINRRQTFRQKVQESFKRAVSDLLLFFTAGRISLFDHPLFFDTRPGVVSQSELDLIIEMSLLGSANARDVLEHLMKNNFGPKSHLKMVQSFLAGLESEPHHDPKMQVNGRAAYLYFQEVAELALKQKKKSEAFLEKLEGYLSKLDAGSYPHQVLSELYEKVDGLRFEDAVEEQAVEASVIAQLDADWGRDRAEIKKINDEWVTEGFLEED